MMRQKLLVGSFSLLPLIFCFSIGVAQQEENQEQKEDSEVERLARLPGGTTKPAGEFRLTPFPLRDGPKCERGAISIPENRAADKSRNIRLYFYRFKARNPSGKPPIFFLPGGPGGYYDDGWVKGLNRKPRTNGSNAEAWLYAQDRDVVLVNQRGAKLPDKTFGSMYFLAPASALDKPYSYQSLAGPLEDGAKRSFASWTKKGMDLAGYDIMNMIEDLNDIRKTLGYDKIVLRGTSFGSQWSMCYMKKYPQFVDRAVLGGVEPIDYGWDSPQGVWNILLRFEKEVSDAIEDDKVDLPKIPLSDAIKAVVKRLEKNPVTVEAKLPKQKSTTKIVIGAEDFQRYFRAGIIGGRESQTSLQNLPKYVFEVYNEDYRYLATRSLQDRRQINGGPIQFILIDNSLGISKAREARLDQETAKRWVGELNSMYRATRDATPTPVVPDSFRALRTDIPVLMVHGDHDSMTPIENAHEQLEDFSNAHLLTIKGGTHGAFHEMVRHDKSFLPMVNKFLLADFDSNDVSIESLELPETMELPKLRFNPISGKSLFEQSGNGAR